MLGRIHEIYSSLSGEGISTGIPTVFIRFAGCSLRCGKTSDLPLWCDTPYALGPKQGRTLEPESILSEIRALDPQESMQILFTGGEPLEGKNGEMVKLLLDRIYSFRIEHSHPYPRPRIETNGKENIGDFFQGVFTLDYKLPDSGMESFMDLKNLEILKMRHNPLDELKFVVRSGRDFERSLEILSRFQPNTHVLYSPVQGELDPRELALWIKQENPPKARLSLQIHKVLWGDQKGV